MPNKNKPLVIALLQAELRHSQLINALHNIKLETHGEHNLKLEEAVAQLMQLKGTLPEQWLTIYNHYMDQVSLESSKKLDSLAEECYTMLWACAKMETTMEG